MVDLRTTPWWGAPDGLVGPSGSTARAGRSARAVGFPYLAALWAAIVAGIYAIAREGYHSYGQELPNGLWRWLSLSVVLAGAITLAPALRDRRKRGRSIATVALALGLIAVGVLLAFNDPTSGPRSSSSGG